MITHDEHSQRRYKKTCPFCRTEYENFRGLNLICSCGGKYYYFDKTWLNRKTGEEVKESETNSEQNEPRNVTCTKIFNELDSVATYSIDKRYMTIPVKFYEELKEYYNSK